MTAPVGGSHPSTADRPPTVPALPADAQHQWAQPVVGWYIVIVLTLAYTCSFIDRQLLTLLIEPIRRDLEITDTQMSLLGGFAFSIFYTTMGIPLARLADRANRRNLMMAGVACWSLMTSASGLVRSFWGLFATRVGVGVGEAALSPAAFSLLADCFPPQRLARAISVYSTGLYFGAGLALMIGGSVIQYVSHAAVHELPLLGVLRPWQYTFLLVGLLGFPIVLLMATIREPLRRGVAGAGAGTQGGSAAGPGWGALRAFVRRNAMTLTCHITAFTLFGIAVNCYLFWSPTLMMRAHGWDAPRAGLTIGALMFVLGTAGVYSGGWVADRLMAKGRADAVLRAAFIGMAAGLPFLVLMPLATSADLAIACLGAAVYFMAFPQGLPSTALQLITPNPLRAQTTAVYFFIGNLIAGSIGPTVPALLTDYVFRDPAKLGLAIVWVEAAVMPLSLLLLWRGFKPYRASVERAAVSLI